MRFVTPARGAAPRRGRTAWPVRLRRIAAGLASGLFVVAALAGIAGLGLLWRSDAIADALAKGTAAIDTRSAELGLTVRSVLVEGRVETPAASVLTALSVQRGQPLLAFDPGAAKLRLEQLGWVREAAVERRFPGTILVKLVERHPLALWQHDGKLALVDDTGSVIARDHIERFASLPIVVGDDAPQYAPALLAMLGSEPGLKSRVTAAVRVSGRRWNLRLDNAIDVRLPEERAEAAWKRLADLDRAYGLLRRDIIAIDLRMPDRLVLQLPPEAAHRLREPGADT